MRNHQNWLQGYIHHTRHSESPTPFHFWTGVSTIAGVLRRKVWINQLHFQWLPNFYIVLVGPPGVAAKSTSINSGMQLLKRVKGVKFGPPSLTWQALTVALQEAQETITFPNGDKKTSCCMTIPVSELGTFLKPDDDVMNSILIDIWDGKEGEWEHATKTTGNTKIMSPWLNIIGCTTPSWMKANFSERISGGGLSSRIVFVFGEKKRKLVAYPHLVMEKETFKTEQDKLVEDLEQMSQLRGEFSMTKEAVEFGTEWYRHLWAGPRSEEITGEKYDDHFARKQTQAHKLAMIISVAQRDDLLITKEDLESAIGMITGLEADLVSMFNSLTTNPVVRQVQEVLRLLSHHKAMEYGLLRKIMFATMSQKDLESAIRDGVSAGYLTCKKVDGKNMVYFNHTPEQRSLQSQGIVS